MKRTQNAEPNNTEEDLVPPGLRGDWISASTPTIANLLCCLSLYDRPIMLLRFARLSVKLLWYSNPKIGPTRKRFLFACTGNPNREPVKDPKDRDISN